MIGKKYASGEKWFTGLGMRMEKKLHIMPKFITYSYLSSVTPQLRQSLQLKEYFMLQHIRINKCCSAQWTVNWEAGYIQRCQEKETYILAGWNTCIIKWLRMLEEWEHPSSEYGVVGSIPTGAPEFLFKHVLLMCTWMSKHNQFQHTFYIKRFKFVLHDFQKVLLKNKIKNWLFETV